MLMLIDGDDDDWFADLLRAFNTPDTLDDDIAEHALDTICFLQDADISTPMDEFPDTPVMLTFTDIELR
jgi:hypothetical protein